MKEITKPSDILKLKTQNGGWTRETLAEWGIPWPPPKGWKKHLEQEYYKNKPYLQKYM